MMKMKATVLICLTMLTASAFAQDTISRAPLKYNPGQVVRESGKFFTSPLRWKASNWITLAGIAGGTVTIMQFDEQIRKKTLEYSEYKDHILVRIGDEWGNFLALPVISLSLYTHGILAKNMKTKRLGFEIAEAALFAEAISIVMKGAFGRARPFVGDGAYNFSPFWFKDRPNFLYSPRNSFPAGHANAAFAMSTVLAMHTRSPVLKVLAYFPSVGTAAARVLTDAHWTSDVFFASALGIVSGYWVVKHHDKAEQGLKVSSVYPLSLTYAIK